MIPEGYCLIERTLYLTSKEFVTVFGATPSGFVMLMKGCSLVKNSPSLDPVDSPVSNSFSIYSGNLKSLIISYVYLFFKDYMNVYTNAISDSCNKDANKTFDFCCKYKVWVCSYLPTNYVLSAPLVFGGIT